MILGFLAFGVWFFNNSGLLNKIVGDRDVLFFPFCFEIDLCSPGNTCPGWFFVVACNLARWVASEVNWVGRAEQWRPRPCVRSTTFAAPSTCLPCSDGAQEDKLGPHDAADLLHHIENVHMRLFMAMLAYFSIIVALGFSAER